MNKHTAGPWESIDIGETDEACCRFAVILTPTKEEEIACKQLRYDGFDIAHCYGSNQEANAALIAAAPDLLEAIEHCIDWFNAAGLDVPAMSQAIAAQQKAKGEA